MKTLVATIIIGLMFVGQSLQQSDEVVNLALYYEPLCPSSQGFIHYGLFKTYPKISSFTNVTLNPYGNAHRTKVDGHWKFRCQHGVNECKLSKLTVCSFQTLDQADQINLVDCLYKLEYAKECITAAHLNYNEIVNCANGEKGDELLAKYGAETDALNPKHTFVPYIVFNGIYNSTLEDNARDDLLATVCSLLQTKNKPRVCLRESDLLYLSFTKETEENLNFY